ncbi:unnamed protein product [Candidula unifasciata]|uniref:Fibrinogen C-terminal domain-containing protein n=1 Tax=Candidula unifasciata TaxID=100452 RepID=A0A8S3ZBF7_9EUPU|nr:unnamed protein product [Candidula unifasciata]
MAIYDTTDKGNYVKLASISVFAKEVSVEPSKNHVINVTGNISNYDGVLNVMFLRDVDCLYGAFQCELDFVHINGQPDVIRENLAPVTEENADILSSLAKISTQLKDTNKQLEGLKNDTGVLKQDNEVTKQDIEVLKQDNEVLKQDNDGLKQDNEVLKAMLASVLVELSSIKELLNSTRDNEQHHESLCYRGMPHKSTREKFLLSGNIQALCDTETDDGGWVVIQRRVRGDVDFYRGWDDYKRGFGTPDTDFWIGNDIIHDLTSQGYNELRIDFIHNETEYFAQYTNFTLADESSKYLITIGGYSGNVFDSMSYHNGYNFSTFDRDNDPNTENCAELVHGAWWYHGCYYANLNGAWGVADGNGIAWHFADNSTNNWIFPSFTEMKVRYI